MSRLHADAGCLIARRLLSRIVSSTLRAGAPFEHLVGRALRDRDPELAYRSLCAVERGTRALSPFGPHHPIMTAAGQQVARMHAGSGRRPRPDPLLLCEIYTAADQCTVRKKDANVICWWISARRNTRGSRSLLHRASSCSNQCRLMGATPTEASSRARSRA
jgi:hypothetical protein